MTGWKGKYRKMASKLFGIISLSRKAGKLTGGFDAVKELVVHGDARLVFFASDVSDRTRRSMEWAMESADKKVPLLSTSLTMFDYGMICGKPTGVLALTDKGFAETATKLIEAENETEIKGGLENI